MIKTNFLYVLIVLIAFASCNHNKGNTAGRGSEGSSYSSTESDKSQVETAVEKLNDLIVNPEEALLKKIAVDELTYGHSSGLIQNKEEFIDDLMNGAFDFSSVRVSDQDIQIVGGAAIVRHIFSAEALNAGEAVDIKIGNILVYVKRDNEWKLLARQAFKL